MYISRRFLQRKNADILLKLTLNTNQSINLQEKPETYLIILILHVCLLKGINENSIKYLIKYCCKVYFQSDIMISLKLNQYTGTCQLQSRTHCGHDRMAVGFTISIRTRCTTLCDKVCQWLATGWWFSPVSSTNKIDRQDIVSEWVIVV